MAMSTLSVNNNESEALKILPTEAANELRDYAEKRGLRCARTLLNKRFKRKTDEIDTMGESGQHFNSFKEKCKGFLSEETCQSIKSMLKCAGRHTASISKSKQCFWPWKRQRYEVDAENDKRKVEEHCRDVIEKREISEELASNLKQMGWAAAWFTACSIFGPQEEKERQMTQLDTYFDRIHGEINLVAMTFNMEEAQILSQEPKVISTKTMENKGAVEQSMKFSFSVTEGKTGSATHAVNFSYGVGATFSAGFAGIGQLSCDLSFNFSHNHSFQTSINKAITKLYEFPLVFPARSTYVAKAMVHEAQMEIPYELVFDFGGACRSVKGLWKGVACGKATYNIERIEGASSPNEPEIEYELEGYHCLIL